MNRRAFLTTTLAAGVAFQARADDSTPKPKVAVIGATGRGGYGHSMDTLWLDVPEVQVVAVADADAKGLAGALQRLKVERGFGDYRQMLTDVKPDIVSIGPRWIEQHHDMTLAAIAAGAKGIYMEKPFCRTLEEADAIVAACQKHQVKLALAHRNRYHPVLPHLVQHVKDGAIGQLLEIRSRGKEDQRGGAQDLWVLGSHIFNLAAYLAGPPVDGYATVLQDGKLVTKEHVKEGGEGVGLVAGNEIHARFRMQNGIPFYFDSLQNAGTKEAGFGLQLIGTKGIIDLRVDAEPLAHIQVGNPFQPNGTPRQWKPVTTAGIDKPESIPDIKLLVGGHRAAALDLIAAIKENREPLCSAQEGLTTVEMIAAIFESHRLGGKQVTFPLATRKNPLALL